MDSYRAKMDRLALFLKLRREQLSLSIQEVQALAKRRGVRKLAAIEEQCRGEWLDKNDEPYIERALQLPPGLVADMKDYHPKVYTMLGTLTAHEVLQLLNEGRLAAAANTGGVTLRTCALCASAIRFAIGHWSLNYAEQPITDKTCICGGRRLSDANVFLRVGISISGVRSILVLGGSPDVDAAFSNIPYVTVVVVRKPGQSGFSPSRLAEVDVVVLAKGQVGHAATAPYLNAMKALAKDRQPLLLRPASPNVTAIASEFIWNSDVLRLKCNRSPKQH